jgi:hypothetical protein
VGIICYRKPPLGKVAKKPIIIVHMIRPIIDRIIIAGIEAIAHLTMKTTIEVKGILMSVTTTSLLDRCGSNAILVHPVKISK